MGFHFQRFDLRLLQWEETKKNPFPAARVSYSRLCKNLPEWSPGSNFGEALKIIPDIIIKLKLILIVLREAKINTRLVTLANNFNPAIDK